MDAGAIIDALGGSTRIAAELNLYPSAVSMWRRSGIPTARCLELFDMAGRLKVDSITLEILLRSRSVILSDKLISRKG
jgi:hypothetical protein